MKTQQFDIAVVGAGIVGIACAYYLALSAKRPKVALIDSLVPMSLTSAASGENYRSWWPRPSEAVPLDFARGKLQAA